eukprot:CAMPEP_0185280824 /NCGR_PEP_ID=MMETSP1359-20130426/66367_1 /TAXON_ID=552665 /ORGANISM="Bigelowiella longifila, Strain CCMP242" /LENGTH=62 /DNA_ID=CAMNT_0027876167 /DNA_START=591 /DNA_END=779 /DNA_ORIENTATION=+
MYSRTFRTVLCLLQSLPDVVKPLVMNVERCSVVLRMNSSITIRDRARYSPFTRKVSGSILAM